MFLIEDHHRETIRDLMHDLHTLGHQKLSGKLAATFLDLIPNEPDPDLTDKQLSKLWKKWRQSHQGVSFGDFLKGAQPTIGCNDAIIVQWCGMWLCIEKDGSCHT